MDRKYTLKNSDEKACAWRGPFAHHSWNISRVTPHQTRPTSYFLSGSRCWLLASLTYKILIHIKKANQSSVLLSIWVHRQYLLRASLIARCHLNKTHKISFFLVFLFMGSCATPNTNNSLEFVRWLNNSLVPQPHRVWVYIYIYIRMLSTTFYNEFSESVKSISTQIL